ncbi:MAG: RagB/SusD family nutrient uptake outer membrane protein [Cyclobacteriaceae bacterium]|nr:RagB/SusD family nutrient uptake outer membrane protein [Cyclobacteriaceae bacterium]
MKFKIIFVFGLLLSATSCNLEIAPFDGITRENLATVPGTLKSATNGTYSLMKDMLPYRGQFDFRSSYARNLYQMLEYPTDNVTLSGTTTDPLFFAATRQHFPAMENSNYVWYVAYKIISLANQNIESVVEGANKDNDYLLGENYFMRAVAQFDLLRLFAKPYSLGKDNLGIPLRLVSSSPDKLARSTVGQCYDQLVSDLLKAATLMANGTSRGVEYASQEAAWALLSRVYLYMEQNDKVIEYATKVIQSTRFQLEPTASYLNLFYSTYTSKESIFVMKHTIQDDKGLAALGSMYLTDGRGWGEVYISQPLRNLMIQNPSDVRYTLIKPQLKSDGVTVETRNNIPKYFITKFSYQDGVVTLSSPHVLRLSEMYLNRAEAYAKKNDNANALADANVIRQRAGLSGAALYTTGNLQGASTVLMAVLQERRLELAYEGHRAMDLYRNKLSMDRNFPGIQPQIVIPFDDPRNIYFIPQDELIVNTLCKQND